MIGMDLQVRSIPYRSA